MFFEQSRANDRNVSARRKSQLVGSEIASHVAQPLFFRLILTFMILDVEHWKRFRREALPVQ